MKKNIVKLFAVLAITIGFVSCKESAKEAETKQAETATEAKVTSTKYVADVKESTIEWTGFKPTEKHFGTLSLDTGVFTVKDNKIESGSFLIDMNSIVVLDIPADKDSNADLVGHLKNEDFFDVANHTNAAFEVTGFEEKEGKTFLSGNLNIKGIKHNISFPVTLSEKGETMTLTSEAFSIDRTKWEIKYKSKSFFSDLGDKFIKDDIELKINVKAKKS